MSENGNGFNGRYTAQQMIEAAQKTGGNKSAAARLLDCHRETVQRYCRNMVTVNAAFEEQRQVMVDWAETGLREAVITRKDPWAIKFVLRTQGKDRGYVERTETEQSGKVIIEVIRGAKGSGASA